nr:alpha/beta-gliadin A-V [Bactrocera oleae]
MKAISLPLYFTVLAVVSAQPGYKYQQPQVGPSTPGVPAVSHQHLHHHHHSVPQAGPDAPLSGPISSPSPQKPNVLYSPIQSPPLQTFNPSPSIPLQPPSPQEIQLPLPQAAPEKAYFPPPQSAGVSSISQNHQQQFLQQQVVQQQAQFGAAQPQQQLGGGAFGLPFGGQGGFQQNFQSFQQPRPQTAIITKDIYIHSAPDDQEETLLGQQLDNAPVRKNYRIVFIKAPTHNIKLAGAALKHAQNANEEKTVIYVLSKKPDLTEVQQQLQQAQGEQKTHKPEVYFIKYKTQEEAQRAQQEIQAQYDALGGSTHISDEGIAPLTSVSGGPLNLGGNIGQQHSSFVQQNFQSAGNYNLPTNKYLPIKKK